MKRVFAASVWQEGECYVAQALEVDVASYGDSADEALEGLREALDLYFEPPTPEFAPKIRSVEVEVDAAQTAYYALLTQRRRRRTGRARHRLAREC